MAIVIKFPTDKISRRVVDRERDQCLENFADEIYEAYLSVSMPHIELNFEHLSQTDSDHIQSQIDKRHEDYLLQIKTVMQKATDLGSSYCDRIERLQKQLNSM